MRQDREKIVRKKFDKFGCVSFFLPTYALGSSSILSMSYFEYLFSFFKLRLPEGNKNKYLTFDTSKSKDKDIGENIFW